MNNDSNLNSPEEEEETVQRHLTSSYVENNIDSINYNSRNNEKRALFLKVAKIVAIVTLVVIILTCIIMLFIPNSPIISIIYSAFSWIDGIPRIWGSLVIGVIYSLGLLLFLPATPFDLVSGLMFGIWLGTLVASIGSIGGAILAFFLGRTLLRNWAEDATKRRPTLLALDRAVANQAFKLVFLSRVSPLLPYPLLNYFFGVTNVRWTTYTIATYLGILPATFVNCYLGSMLRNIHQVFENASDNKTQIIIMICGAFLTIVVLILVTIITRRALNKALAEQNALMEQDYKEEEVVEESEDKDESSYEDEEIYLEMRHQDITSETSDQSHSDVPSSYY